MADERALECVRVFNLFNNPNFLSPNNQFCSRTVPSCNFGPAHLRPRSSDHARSAPDSGSKSAARPDGIGGWPVGVGETCDSSLRGYRSSTIGFD